MWEDINAWVVGEWEVISAAPGAFIVAMLAGWFLIWRVVQWQHSVKLGNLESSLALYRERSTVAAVTASEAVPSVTEERKPKPKTRALARHDDETEEFIDPTIDIEKLRTLWASASSVDEQMKLGRFFGKWMKVSGEVIYTRYNNPTISAQIKVPSGYSDVILIFKEITPEIRALKVRDQISVVGRLHSVDALGVALLECELDAVW